MHTNIVLLADGTGNSSASPFKTNVWRLYQALDIKDPPPSGEPRQIVYYNDGVGTESFKPLAALGGAFGIGVWKNVKDLYRFVCRNYVPADPANNREADQIYGFGFSRGAFTIRLLMGLIGRCGIVKAVSDAQLDQCVEMAYQAYRRDFLIRAAASRTMIYNYILKQPKYNDPKRTDLPPIDLSGCSCCRDQHVTDIRFVGVWDTVDAYGMPVDELKFAIDDWIWPMSFADRDPSERLLTLRHALSLDDERPTFRPVLWNEVLKDKEDPTNESKQKKLDAKRIQQVWFPGVHANVGGGYPDDGMAYGALSWIMTEAEKEGLRYFDAERNQIAARVSPQGKHYDSRAGLGGYYRYGPRKVGELCDDPEHEVKVPIVHVHESAFRRITARERNYSPVSLGVKFSVDGNAQPPPLDEDYKQALDLVWWRRFAYFRTLELTAFCSLFVLWLVFEWPNRVLRCTEAVLQGGWSYVTWVLGPGLTEATLNIWNWLLGQVGAVLPGWIGPVLRPVQLFPLSAIVPLSLLLLVFLVWSPRLQRRVEAQAEWAWRDHKKLFTAPKDADRTAAAKHEQTVAASAPKKDWYNTIGRPGRAFTAWLYKGWLRAVVIILGVVIGAFAFVLFLPYLLWKLFLKLFRPRPCWMK
jgi:uncharacterized protein (DUF2235 family)